MHNSIVFVLIFILPLLVNCRVHAPAPPNLDLWLGSESKESAKTHPDTIGNGAIKLESVKCVVCSGLVESLHWVWARNTTIECVAELVATVCKTLDIQDQHVCDAISGEFKEEVLYVIGELGLQPGEVCGLLLDNCGTPENPFRSNWTLEIPGNKPVPVSIPLPKPSAPKLRVLHLTDIHVDFDYLPLAEAECQDPLCCRTNETNTGKGPIHPAGYWGHVGKCDLPLWTLENMFEHISKNEQFDYIIWTGDLPPHNIWEGGKLTRIKQLQKLTDLFLRYFPKKPVYSAVGNHESIPVDSFPPKDFAPKGHDKAWLYDSLATEWEHWLPNTTDALIKSKASYSVTVRKGFKLISINTQYCDKYNFWLYLNQTDPDGVLEWLTKELLSAEEKGEYVHIIGHIPPGDSQCLPPWSQNYYKLVNRFENTIRAQFFGHTHHDSFSIFYEDMDPRKRATNSLFVGPSVTTFPDLLPAYRIYEIDGDYRNSSWAVLDHETFRMNVTDANLMENVKWEKEYSFKEFYGSNSLSSKDLNEVLQRLITNESLLADYLRFYFRQKDPQCDSNCRHDKLCEIRSAKTPSLNDVLCKDLSPQSRLYVIPELTELSAIKRLKPRFRHVRKLWQTCRLPFLMNVTKNETYNRTKPKLFSKNQDKKEQNSTRISNSTKSLWGRLFSATSKRWEPERKMFIRMFKKVFTEMKSRFTKKLQSFRIFFRNEAASPDR